MKFYLLVLELHLPQNFFQTHTKTQTDRHFLEIVKTCSKHPKTCKFHQKPEVENFTKPILSSIYIEKSSKLSVHHMHITIQ